MPARTEELVKLLGCEVSDVLTVSGKTGQGVAELLDAIVSRVPPPPDQSARPVRALIFDSAYDDYRGVVASVRVIDGAIKKNDRVRLMATGAEGELLELGAFVPGPSRFHPLSALENGQIGYVVTGLKDIQACRVGDTLTLRDAPAAEPLAGYQQAKPMVYAGIFPKEGSDFTRLREGMERLKLNDAALSYEPEHQPALGYGFRCGMLGMLHLEIVKERLRREFGLDLVVTVPSVAYRVHLAGGGQLVVKSPLELPDPSRIASIEEPWVAVDIVTPVDYVGAVMQFLQERRGTYKTTEYLSPQQAILHYDAPLSMVIVDFYDRLKSLTSGYASLNYEFKEYRTADVVRLDILVAEEAADALAQLVYRDQAERIGRRIVSALKETIPQAWFVIKLQAAVGGKIVAAERIAALRKDVMAKMSGGDVTRKRKLLEKQKKGKAKMAELGAGSVEIPTDAYLSVLRRD